MLMRKSSSDFRTFQNLVIMPFVRARVHSRAVATALKSSPRQSQHLRTTIRAFRFCVATDTQVDLGHKQSLAALATTLAGAQFFFAFLFFLPTSETVRAAKVLATILEPSPCSHSPCHIQLISIVLQTRLTVVSQRSSFQRCCSCSPSTDLKSWVPLSYCEQCCCSRLAKK